MTGAPDGIVLPKATGGGDVALLDARLAVREALHGIADGGTRIVAIATESAAAIFGLGTYTGASRRLAGLDLGCGGSCRRYRRAVDPRRRRSLDGAEPARAVLALFGAAAAGVAAIDTVYTDFRDLDGLEAECRMARRDGFSRKLAIHPDQVPVINEAFTPSPEAIERARAVVETFRANPEAGVVGIDGEMVDRPHLLRAERLLRRAGQF